MSLYVSNIFVSVKGMFIGVDDSAMSVEGFFFWEWISMQKVHLHDEDRLKLQIEEEILFIPVSLIDVPLSLNLSGCRFCVDFCLLDSCPLDFSIVSFFVSLMVRK